MLKILLQNVQFYFWMSMLKKCDSKQQNGSVCTQRSLSQQHARGTHNQHAPERTAGQRRRSPCRAAAASGRAATKRVLGHGEPRLRMENARRHAGSALPETRAAGVQTRKQSAPRDAQDTGGASPAGTGTRGGGRVDTARLAPCVLAREPPLCPAWAPRGGWQRAAGHAGLRSHRRP